jgi:hypothetical protein
MALQIRRGTEAQRAALTGVDVPVLGELLYTADTKKLYVGDGVTGGGTEVGYFSSVAVSGQDTIVSTGTTGALTFDAGTNITLTTNDNTNTLTIDAASFTGGTVDNLVVGETFSATPTDLSVEIEGFSNRMMRMVSNMSSFDATASPFIQMAAYRASPANNNAGPKLEFRQSTTFSPDNIIAGIKSVVTNIATGSEAGKLVFDVINSPAVVSIDSTGFVGDLTGDVTGDVTGNVTGDVTGDVTGNVYAIDTTLMVNASTKEFTGNLIGNVTGNVTGFITGDVKGSVFADDSTVLVDGPSGVLRGEHIGTLTGNVIGSVDTGSLTISGTTVITNNLAETINITTVGGRIRLVGKAVTERIDLTLDINNGGIGIFNQAPTNSVLGVVQAHNTANVTNLTVPPSQPGDPIGGSPIVFSRSRGTLLSPTAIQAADDIIAITFVGFDGTGFSTSANIIAAVPSTATVATGIVEGSLKLEVADATGTLATKFKIEAERVSSLKPFNLVSVDSTARALLVPAFGDIIYNTTANKFQGWQNTGGTTPQWVDLS